MKKIIHITNNLGGIMCLLVIANFWLKKALGFVIYRPQPFDFNYFDFLEKTTPIDPIDFANFLIYLYKIILCVT